MKFFLNSNIFIQENALEHVVCEMASILSRPQCDNWCVHRVSHKYWPIEGIWHSGWVRGTRQENWGTSGNNFFLHSKCSRYNKTAGKCGRNAKKYIKLHKGIKLQQKRRFLCMEIRQYNKISLVFHSHRQQDAFIWTIVVYVIRYFEMVSSLKFEENTQ